VRSARDIFVLASRRLGLAPSSCLVFEEAVSGVTAARAAECRCLGITSSFTAGQIAAAGAGWTATNLASAPDAAIAW
jgi:beta-phosphoglucomutase-like phosphatase (HAD superfamily)